MSIFNPPKTVANSVNQNCKRRIRMPIYDHKLLLLLQVTLVGVHKSFLFRLSLRNNWAYEAKNKDSQIRCDQLCRSDIIMSW